MQTEEHQIFRFNWQVGVIVALTAFALIIPLAGVGICIQRAFHPKVLPVVAQPEPPFRKSLEDIANQKLGPSTSLGDEQKSIELQTENIDPEVSRIEKLAKSFGGFALPAEQSEAGTRVTIQISANQVEDFLKACRDSHETAKPAPPDDTRVLVEVMIKTKAP